ncbi:Glycerol-3-phosphate acyltransferase [Acaryochloris thomasi RCC1774]|uniref:Glycerol-3-phosphate acyltransferase n=1 Tax=Acaryochloris thomasi RCC1774 TaxID=1764569 RepID=A0A2W1K4N2_9CYAN|nr:glycerol-3-phosphate 1-O-acyltransferase PlsY [Acaryochloris thomasi]PZD74757.1 Glycerol-3-phosphate acyltransferase [Acaryochloris thomasi RCC1774]
MVLWIVLNGVILIAAYFLGSFPTGFLLGKALQGIDIREHGSKSTGATNVLRTLGKGPGATVLIVDVLKGAAAIAVAQWAYTSSAGLLGYQPETVNPGAWMPWTVVLAGLAVVLGHSKSIWLKFQGGKSVATGLGLLLMLNWQVGLTMLGIFSLVLALSRMVSLSSISAVLALPILMVLFHQPIAYLCLGIVGGLYVVWRHWANIERILAGTEPRLGQKSTA